MRTRTRCCACLDMWNRAISSADGPRARKSATSSVSVRWGVVELMCDDLHRNVRWPESPPRKLPRHVDLSLTCTLHLQGGAHILHRRDHVAEFGARHGRFEQA